jgi:membrane fusion protein, multidrug efflux system
MSDSTRTADPVVETPKTAPAKANKGRTKTLIIILSILLVGGVIGTIWWAMNAGFEETDNATVSGHIHPVSSRVAGTVERVLVEDNSIVKQGQVLVTIDPADLRLALSQAKNNLLVAQAQAKTAQKNIALAQRQAASQLTQAQGTLTASQSTVNETRQTVGGAQAAVETARQGVLQQDANYQRALADYQRYAALDPEAVSAQQLDTAKTNMKVAEAARGSAMANLNQARARLTETRASVASSMSRVTQARGTYQGAQAQGLQVEVARSEYANALAHVKVAEDQVRQAQLNLSYGQVKAPASGRIGRRTVESGQRLQSGEPLMAIVSNRIWVTANFKETQMQQMKEGNPVEVHIDTFPDHEFKGWIESFSPASGAQFALLPPENATGNFTKIVQRIPVRIELDPKSVKGYENRLTPGMSVIAKVNTNTRLQSHAAVSRDVE